LGWYAKNLGFELKVLILVLVTTIIDAKTDAGFGSELPGPSEPDQGGIPLSDEEVAV